MIVLSIGLSAPLHAEDRARAQQAYRTAKQHFELGEYQEALAGFKEAYRNFEDPIFIFNLAQCQRIVGDKQQAVRSFRMFLIKAPGAENRAEVEGIIARLEAQLQAEAAARPASPPQQNPEPAPAPAPAPAPDRAPSPGPATVTTTTVAPTPLYKRWWLWTAVGVVVAAGVGVGVGVGLSQAGRTPTATTDFGTIKF